MKKMKMIIPLLIVFLMTLVLQSCKTTYWNPKLDSYLLSHKDIYDSTKWTWTGDPKIDSLVKKLPQDNWRAALACRKWAVDPEGQICGTYIPDQHLYLKNKEIAILTAFLLGVPEVTIKEGECGGGKGH